MAAVRTERSWFPETFTCSDHCHPNGQVSVIVEAHFNTHFTLGQSRLQLSVTTTLLRYRIEHIVCRLGADMIVQAKAGTGKTLVFGIICLDRVQVDIAMPQVTRSKNRPGVMSSLECNRLVR